uniref:Ribosome recycling factor domain-containing protein n=1 Tax=Globisporangium ultimum (strain ATCC 200006 / CBS 805.95 / DAOM BR144) TaxID=431595 RepID=K3WEP9_GLOUD
MALRMIAARCVRRAASVSSRRLPAAASAAANHAPALAAPVSQLSVRYFAKAAKKQKGGKPAAPPANDDSDDGATDGAFSLETTKKNMNGAVLNFTRQLNQMRPGKADAGIFDDLNVQAYGQYVSLSQLAQVAVSGTHSLSVTVYDPSLLVDIRKAIETMNPVYSVREDGANLEISFPKMSKETRAELQKAVKKQAEQARQHVRRVRQDAMNQAKKLKEEISEDDVKKQTEQIQKLTDDAVNEIGKLLAAKEKDLVAV